MKLVRITKSSLLRESKRPMLHLCFAGCSLAEYDNFFLSKNGDVQPSAPPSISLAPLHDVDLSLMDLNDLPSCNDQQESFVWPGSTSTASREMLAVPTQINHVAVIKHVPATVQSSLRASLPPVSTLASPTNSPTSLHAPYSFYSSSASSPTDLVQPEMAASPLKASPVSGISPVIFTVNGKVRRHSDSDNIVPPKRLKATVTDMLRHTINLNIARKLGSGYSENDLTASFSSHCGNFQEVRDLCTYAVFKGFVTARDKMYVVIL